jgi:hypothetical protein
MEKCAWKITLGSRLTRMLTRRLTGVPILSVVLSIKVYITVFGLPTTRPIVSMAPRTVPALVISFPTVLSHFSSSPPLFQGTKHQL